MFPVQVKPEKRGIVRPLVSPISRVSGFWAVREWPTSPPRWAVEMTQPRFTGHREAEIRKSVATHLTAVSAIQSSATKAGIRPSKVTLKVIAQKGRPAAPAVRLRRSVARQAPRPRRQRAQTPGCCTLRQCPLCKVKNVCGSEPVRKRYMVLSNVRKSCLMTTQLGSLGRHQNA